MNKRLLCLLAVLLLAAGCLLAGCAAEEGKETTAEPEEDVAKADPGMRASVVYYADRYGNVLPVMRQIAWDENMAEKVVGAMIQSEEQSAVLEDQELEALLPEDTEIDVKVEDRVASVKLESEEIEDIDEDMERRIVTAVVNTLTEFDEIDSVKLEINGKEEAPNGTDLSEPMSAQPINKENKEEENTISVGLFYKNEDSGLLVPVTRYVEGEELNPETVIEEILKDPEAEGLTGAFPEGTKLKEYTLDGEGTLTLDFSEEFAGLSEDKQKEKDAIKVILLACKQIEGVKDVIINVEGEEYKASTEPVMAVPEFVNELNTF